ncbi:hypothetical protein JQ604_11065 [Bradyrhizobium jicamae]|nr:hypothetical protein [Bradyrhizobium jicamae]
MCFTGAQTLAPSLLRADVMKCKIDGFSEKIFITTSPDTNQSDGQYARIGISPGAGNRALAFADRMGAHVFIELNTDGTPIGLFTVQKDLHVINARQSIDPSGSVLAPSQSAGACSRCVGLRACLH